MPIKFGNTTIDKIIYNNTDLDKVYFKNGNNAAVLVFFTPYAYNGQSFRGDFSSGIISGPQVKKGVNSAIYGPIDQAPRGATYTSGAISDSYTQTTSDGYGLGGFATVGQIDLTNIQSIRVNQTFHWWVRNITTSSPDWVYVQLNRVYACTKSGNDYVTQAELYGTQSGVVPGYTGNNGYNTTTGAWTFNCSSLTGNYYLFFQIEHSSEAVGINAQTTINSIILS